MSTQEVWNLLLQHQNGFFGDLTLENPVRPHHRLAQPERHDDVVPCRIGRLGDISRRRVRLGMGMGMDHADEFGTTIFSVAVGLKMHLRVDCVDPTRRCPIGTWIPSVNDTRFSVDSRPATE